MPVCSLKSGDIHNPGPPNIRSEATAVRIVLNESYLSSRINFY